MNPHTSRFSKRRLERGREVHQERCEQHLTNVHSAADRLMNLAREGDDICDHDDCQVLDGIIRDCAMQIRNMAGEVEGHIVESYKKQLRFERREC